MQLLCQVSCQRYLFRCRPFIAWHGALRRASPAPALDSFDAILPDVPQCMSGVVECGRCLNLEGLHHSGTQAWHGLRCRWLHVCTTCLHGSNVPSSIVLRWDLAARSTDPLWEAGSSLRSMMAPFLKVLPHAALRKIVISQFLRPLKPLHVTVAAPEGDYNNGEDIDGLQRAFSNFQPSRRQRGSECGSMSNVTNSGAGCAERGVLVRPQESLEVRNSKEFLIAHLDALSAADLAARLS